MTISPRPVRPLRPLRHATAPLVGALLLAACNQGGGGGMAAPPAEPPPALAFLAPQAGALGQSGAVLVRIAVESIDDPLASVDFTVDGAPAGVALAFTGEVLIGQLELEPGPHLLRAAFAGPPTAADEVAIVVQHPQAVDDGQAGSGPLDGTVGAVSAPVFALVSPTPSADFGRGIAPLDDVDGDGTADFAVGASSEGPGGRVHFRSGADGALLFTVAGAPGERFGTSLGSVADVDGDGRRELAVGAIGAENGRGAAYLLSGADGSELWRVPGPDPDDGLGTSIAGLGDANGDGTPDVVVGARLSKKIGVNGGRVLVLSGADGALLHDLVGEMAFVQAGTDVASAGDFDGDGRGDFAAGSWGSGDNGPASGAVTVYSGATGAELGRVAGPDPNDHFGASVSYGGDFDGDGDPDLVVGAPYALERGTGGLELGEVRAFDGQTLAPLWVRSGFDNGAEFGREVQAIDDVDGDGIDDVLVGAPLELKGQGAVHILSGATGARLERRLGPPVVGFFGATCARIDDLDGDGRDEWAIGAPGFSGGAVLGGAAFVYTAGGLGVTDDGVTVDPFGGLSAQASDADGDDDAAHADGAPGAWALCAWGPGAWESGAADGAPTEVLATGIGRGRVTFPLDAGQRAALEGWRLRAVVATPSGLRYSNAWRPARGRFGLEGPVRVD